MRTIYARSLTFGALAMLALAVNTSAQEQTSPILNSLEVQRLVSRADVADHARLSTHFAALADEYTAEAKRHTVMSQSFIVNPSRNLSAGMSAHCKRLAALNTESATAVRELAAYHEKVAKDAPATAPTSRSAFEAGAGARKPTDEELMALAASAGTVADHQALEAYFLNLAKRYETQARQQAGIASTYRSSRLAPAAGFVDRLVADLRAAAKEAATAAAMHKQMTEHAR